MTAWVIVGLCALNLLIMWRWQVTITRWGQALERERRLLARLGEVHLMLNDCLRRKDGEA